MSQMKTRLKKDVLSENKELSIQRRDLKLKLKSTISENKNLHATIGSMILTIARVQKEKETIIKHNLDVKTASHMQKMAEDVLERLTTRTAALESECRAFERLHHHAVEERDELRKERDAVSGWLPLILDERARQEEKWGEQNHNDYYWLGILFEEAGDVAKALIENCDRADPFYGVKNSIGVNLNIQLGSSEDALRKELSHVAAVAVAWIDAMNRRAVV